MSSKIKSFLKLIKYLLFHRYPNLKKEYKKSNNKNLLNVITDINFAIILDFWYLEMYKNTDTDWTSLQEHEVFYKWMKETVHYIEHERPLLINKINNSLNEASSHKEASEETLNLYKHYRDVTNELFDRDTLIISEYIKNRNFFWT
jgi:hypothetical protein